jgi:FkbM family methyltransferase
MSHSQNGEDLILLEHFADAPPGRLLDIGAYAVEALSNSRALIERGWHAVLVEPSPKPFCGLLDAYGGNPNVTLVNVAIAETAGLHAWYDSNGDAVSTLDELHRRKWAGTVSYSPMLVNATTVAAMLERVGRDFDLLTMDTEGTSARLLGQFPLDEMERLKALVIEHDNQVTYLDSELVSLGFRRAMLNAENAVYLR